MPAVALKTETLYNPLDIAESVIMDRDWMFDRTADEELCAEVTGAGRNYRIWFSWQEDCGGLTLSCALDTKFPKQLTPRIHALLALVNEKLWLGHFDACSDDSTILFRHSLLVKDGAGASAEQLCDLLDIAISECDRFYPAFQSLVWGGRSPADALLIAMFETVAEA